MTKAEFIHLLASDERVGSKKRAGEVVDAFIDGISGALARSEDRARGSTRAPGSESRSRVDGCRASPPGRR